jgi:hypothetical protein
LQISNHQPKLLIQQKLKRNSAFSGSESNGDEIDQSNKPTIRNGMKNVEKKQRADDSIPKSLPDLYVVG